MKLSQLSNQEIETRLKELVTNERQMLHVILEHIKEVDTRRLYLERAYSSIFEYLVKEFHYSGSAAMRRLEAARFFKEVPAVAQKIQEGSLNLSQIGELSRAIKESEKVTGQKISMEQKNDLVSTISGKSTQQTQKELAVALNIEIKEPERQRVQQDESVCMGIILSKIQYQKLSRCKDLAAHLLEQNRKDSSWASVIEVLCDQYLNRKEFSSSSRQLIAKAGAIIEFKAEAKPESKTGTRTEAELAFIAASEMGSVNESLTPKVRREILARDKCCQLRRLSFGLFS